MSNIDESSSERSMSGTDDPLGAGSEFGQIQSNRNKVEYRKSKVECVRSDVSKNDQQVLSKSKNSIQSNSDSVKLLKNMIESIDMIATVTELHRKMKEERLKQSIYDHKNWEKIAKLYELIEELVEMQSEKDNRGDPIFDGRPDQLAFEVVHQEAFKMYKVAVQNTWIPEEIVLSEDREVWQTLTQAEQHYLGMVLSFFAIADNLVNQNLIDNFVREVKMPEASMFYQFQIHMENVHKETYANLIKGLIVEEQERDRLINGVKNFKSIELKANWINKWMNSLQPFAVRLVAFAAVEGVFFSSSFAAIFWIKSKKKLDGLASSNKFISRDEALHTNFAILLLNTYSRKRPADNIIEDIIRDAVEVEKAFVRESLPVDLVGMNKDLMQRYVEYVGNYLSWRFIGRYIYENAKSSPFDFMNNICMDDKTSFFERKVVEYHRTGASKFKFELKDDF